MATLLRNHSRHGDFPFCTPAGNWLFEVWVEFQIISNIEKNHIGPCRLLDLNRPTLEFLQSVLLLLAERDGGLLFEVLN